MLKRSVLLASISTNTDYLVESPWPCQKIPCRHFGITLWAAWILADMYVFELPLTLWNDWLLASFLGFSPTVSSNIHPFVSQNAGSRLSSLQNCLLLVLKPNVYPFNKKGCISFRLLEPMARHERSTYQTKMREGIHLLVRDNHEGGIAVMQLAKCWVVTCCKAKHCYLLEW